MDPDNDEHSQQHAFCNPSNQEQIFQELKLKPENFCSDYKIDSAQKWLTLAGKNGKLHKFPFKTILPKVQMLKHVSKRQLPRDVELDRRRKQYEKVDLVQELEKHNISQQDLLPTEEQYGVLTENAFRHYLPLSFFDDTSYDCHTPQAWLQLGETKLNANNATVVYPLPAKAFLPHNQSLIDYSWQTVAVSGYNAATEKWSIMSLMEELHYELPRIQIMFLAENPMTFIERIQSAAQRRDMAETQLKGHDIMQNVLWQFREANHYANLMAFEKLMANVKINWQACQPFRNEIYLLFEHLMVCLEFEHFAKQHAKEFPKSVGELIKNSLPQAFKSESSANEIAYIKSLGIQIGSLRKKLLAFSIFYVGAGIESMSAVAVECQYIETLSIFVCSFAKPLPLSDFLSNQQTNSTKVANYLKNTWPVRLASAITLVLRVLGKGWLDISLSKWSVYMMCKISRYILQVKFRMQESMQVLLESSIQNFTRFLSEPCLQFLQLDESYKWQSDFIITEFPYVKPIFAMIISITPEREVVYSSNPKEFPPALKQVFKKSLEKTSGVRCIDAEVMSKLRFATNLYILTVELIEDFYLQCDELLQQCFLKAVYPMQQYAAKYNRFIDFYLLNVANYMKEYKESGKPSAQVKRDILEHKRCKEEMREILPANITIGPFFVIVDPTKQYMIKKRIEIVGKIFEYYVERMYDTNEKLLENCMEIYNKVNERPQSIEHLFEIRDFALTVPAKVEELKAEIQVMWIEYDMLDSFFYNLTDHQFAMKWEVYACPKNIMDRLSTLREEQKLDTEEFQRLHASECAGFEERLESLNDEIQAFSLQFNPNKVVETAVEVKKTWKTIQDLQKQGEVLKFRQQLFELDELSLEFLDSIINGFMPYKNLWYSCLDLVKLEEATLGNPIKNIELDDVQLAIDTIRSSLQNSLEIFYEKPEIQGVAHYFLQQLDEFVPKFHAIIDIRNENWLFLHWQELSSLSGIDIKYSMAMNFMYLVRKGILEHLQLVHEISTKATLEADAIRRAFEEEERRKEEERLAILMRKNMRKCRTDIV